MNLSIHKCVCNVNAVSNSTQYSKFDKYKVQPANRNWAETCCNWSEIGGEHRILPQDVRPDICLYGESGFCVTTYCFFVFCGDRCTYNLKIHNFHISDNLWTNIESVFYVIFINFGILGWSRNVVIFQDQLLIVKFIVFVRCRLCLNKCFDIRV